VRRLSQLAVDRSLPNIGTGERLATLDELLDDVGDIASPLQVVVEHLLLALLTKS